MTIKWLRWADDKLTEGKEIEKVNSSSTYNKIYCLSLSFLRMKLWVKNS